MYKLQMQDTRNNKPDLKDKILGMTLHTENAKKKKKKKESRGKKTQRKFKLVRFSQYGSIAIKN